jgi:hypothetical protein
VHVLENLASNPPNDSGPNSAKATPVPEKATDATKKKTATKPATVKRQPSDIFKSFAKGANKAKKVASTESSAAPSPAPTTSAKEDESMGGMSDDDPDNPAEDEEIEVDAGTGKSKKDREADLKAMMDFDDEPMEDVEEEATQGAIDTPKESEAEDSQGTKQEELQESMTVENGRRRGRRRVMKKKTVKDDEGYLGEFLFIATASQTTLTRYSDKRGSSMGVLLRRRTRAEESQTYTSPGSQRCKERCCQAWTRQHHVFLWEEVIVCSRSRRKNIVA